MLTETLRHTPPLPSKVPPRLSSSISLSTSRATITPMPLPSRITRRLFGTTPRPSAPSILPWCLPSPAASLRSLIESRPLLALLQRPLEALLPFRTPSVLSLRLVVSRTSRSTSLVLRQTLQLPRPARMRDHTSTMWTMVLPHGKMANRPPEPTMLPQLPSSLPPRS